MNYYPGRTDSLRRAAQTVNRRNVHAFGASAGAAYFFARTGGTWSQRAYVKASNTSPDALFGQALALSATTLAVGAPGDASNATGVNGDQADVSSSQAGAVYVFR